MRGCCPCDHLLPAQRCAAGDSCLKFEGGTAGAFNQWQGASKYADSARDERANQGKLRTQFGRLSNMSEIAIKVDGLAQRVDAQTKPTQIFAESKEIVVCKINGVLRDLWTDLVEGDEVEGVAISSPEGLAVLRHSTAHVMAQAVQQSFDQTRLGIGPPITDGFYYDFDPQRPFNPEDLDKIESAMRKIVKEGQRFKRRVTTEKDALKELAHEPYKCELIGIKSGAGDEASVEVGGTELTIYDNLGRDGQPVWSDLCRGPHLPSTKHIPAFK